MSDAIKISDNIAMQKFMSLQYALYMTCFVSVLGGGFFLATALFVEEDRAKADTVIKRKLPLIFTHIYVFNDLFINSCS